MSDPKPPQRIAFLGDYPPRLCGIATFTHDLCEAVAGAAPDSNCFVAAVNDRLEGYPYPLRVRFQMQEKDLDSYRRAADFLNFDNADVLCVQHEFGIFGGPAGSHLLSLLKEVRMPIVTTLHTVLREPNDAQRQVMNELLKRSDRIVVMAQKGAEILRDTYGVADAKVDIRHSRHPLIDERHQGNVHQLLLRRFFDWNAFGPCLDRHALVGFHYVVS